MPKSLRIAFVLLACLPGFALAADSPPESSGVPATTRVDESTSVPMDMISGKPVVSVKVNGKGPYRFVLDSSALTTAFDGTFAKELGLKPTGEGAVTIDSLRLGDATFTHFGALVLDRSKSDSKSDAPKGVLGLSLFHDALLTLDYPGEIVRVAQGALQRVGATDVVPFRVADGVPSIAVDVAGHKLDAQLDAGSPGTLTLPSSLEDSVPGPLRGFKLGTHTYDSLAVDFAPGLARAKIGRGILEHYAVTFDQKRSRVRLAYVEHASSTADASLASARRFGLRLRELANGNVEVAALDPGSPAEATGVQQGDLVIGIDGRSIAAMSPAERKAAWAKPSLMLNVRRGEQRYGYTLTRSE